MWIGAVRSQTSKKEFEWADGSQVGYVDWGTHSPTCSKPGYDCLAMQSKTQNPDVLDGQWADFPCDLMHHFVCETEAGATITVDCCDELKADTDALKVRQDELLQKMRDAWANVDLNETGS